MKKGLFIVLEGIDGSGTTTQIGYLANHIRSLSKYADILTTREPWDSNEIKKRLAEDKEVYSGAEKMTALFVQDRLNHLEELIKPNINNGVHIISDRYMMSTFAYQGAQGIDLEAIRDLHHGMLRPDITFFLDVDPQTAVDRVVKRGESLEKFEKDREFIEKLVGNYRDLSTQEALLGEVVSIDGTSPIEEVTSRMVSMFDKYLERKMIPAKHL